MRLLTILVIMFIAVIAFGFWITHTLDAETAAMTEIIENIQQEIDEQNWDKALKKTIDLEKTWSKKTAWWPMIIEHQEIDNIDFSIGRLVEYVATRDTALSKGQLSEIKLMMRHIPEMEAVLLRNIL